ncbi:MAG: hypothetical protein HKO85_10190 [Xanthomonadales bacterium]|nr:hypothetical protein [Gammaproteobacteria bacterium]NNJ79507.1 hypothetical protein [Xanthomonadales bacterium]NNL05646.1 hypothetical protein [Xanthomonadales bacterium]
MKAVLAWHRERMPILLFGLLSVYLGLAATDASTVPQESSPLMFAVQVLAAWCLVAAFRIQDDIYDLPRDAVRTPYRVLVGVSDLRPFWFTALGLLTVGSLLLLVLTGWLGPALVLALAVCFDGLYRFGLGYREYWVLLKYPIIVVAIGAEHWAAPLLVYLCFGIYERIQDESLREKPGSMLILICYFVCVGLVTVMSVNGSWWLWMVAWSATTALSLLAYTRRLPALAPAFFVFSALVFQGARNG